MEIFNQINSDVYSILIKNQIEFQKEVSICYKFVDVFLPEDNIIIELDGKNIFLYNF